MLGGFHAARRARREREVLLLVLQEASAGLKEASDLAASPGSDRSPQAIPSTQRKMD